MVRDGEELIRCVEEEGEFRTARLKGMHTGRRLQLERGRSPLQSVRVTEWSWQQRSADPAVPHCSHALALRSVRSPAELAAIAHTALSVGPVVGPMSKQGKAA